MSDGRITRSDLRSAQRFSKQSSLLKLTNEGHENKMFNFIIFSFALFSTALMLPVGVICFVIHYDIPNVYSSSNQMFTSVNL